MESKMQRTVEGGDPSSRVSPNRVYRDDQARIVQLEESNSTRVFMKGTKIGGSKSPIRDVGDGGASSKERQDVITARIGTNVAKIGEEMGVKEAQESSLTR
ncbi:hypothetical protein U1Q18_034534 [Sarracenia purpurea var. burkii]